MRPLMQLSRFLVYATFFLHVGFFLDWSLVAKTPSSFVHNSGDIKKFQFTVIFA